MYRSLTIFTRLLAQSMALLGGGLLICVVAITFISIAGRALVPLDIGLGPIRGIYDITEIGIAAAVFAFLPWCQFVRGHAAVDLFKPAFPGRMNRILDLLLDAGMLAVAVLIAWRLYLGMLDKHSYSETTLIAQIPVWQGFALSLIGAVAFVWVAGFCVVRSLRVLIRPATAEDVV
jgi:TRAP-type C4-dicarboxylate transport system permease small subunit